MRSLILLLALIAVPVVASAQVPLDSEETRLVITDSQNAHMVAKLALDTVACIMTALDEETDWVPEDCLASLRTRLTPLGLEHQQLHPMVTRLIQGKMTQKRS